MTAAPVGAQQVDVVQPQNTPPGESPRVVQYAPGVRIDWSAMHVELAGEVVQREGPIELFACSRGTREHESIVRIDARPLHVFEALGLIGLEPGKPGYFDDASRKWIVPTGDRVQAGVRLDVPDAPDGTHEAVTVWQWMREVETKQMPQSRDWVFCGSRRTEDGAFLADAEGTVLCVVDFAEALIALAEAHTADNAEIWLEADPRHVPPKGTRCTIVLHAATDVAKPSTGGASHTEPASGMHSSSAGASESTTDAGG